MDSAYDKYRQLVARVEAFGQAVRQRYAGQVRCQAGCDGCCYQQFTIFPVEAYHLQQTVAALSPQERQDLGRHVQQHAAPWQLVEQPQPCVLLDNGHCRLYAGRPLLCRMHGYPLYSSMIERPDGSQRDCCPLNFPDVPLSALAPQAVYNLDLVNHTLAAINHLFAQTSATPDQRVSMRQAVSHALGSLGVTAAQVAPGGRQA
jgi:uncharacterized protein